jgi:hypothetical protein
MDIAGHALTPHAPFVSMKRIPPYLPQLSRSGHADLSLLFAVQPPFLIPPTLTTTPRDENRWRRPFSLGVIQFF